MKASADRKNQAVEKSVSDRGKSVAELRENNYGLSFSRATGNQGLRKLFGANLNSSQPISVTTRPANAASEKSLAASPALTLQAKLTVNAPGDSYEQEADRIADKVTSMSESQAQRSCVCTDGGCATCGNKGAAHEVVQTKHIQPSGNGQTAAPPIVHEVLGSSGQPLDSSTRAFMELRFGQDFGHVRTHTDAQAATSAREISALAYTVGSNIVFGAGQFATDTSQGRRLLAHELTHVLQQRERGVPSRLLVGESQDSHEQQADRTARAALVISPGQPGMNGVKLQKKADEEGTINKREVGRQSVERVCGPTRKAEECQICLDSNHEEWAKNCPDVGASGPEHNYIYVNFEGKNCWRAQAASDFENKRDKNCPLPYDKTKWVPGGDKTNWPGGDRKKKR